MDAGCHKTERILTEEYVWHQIDEARGKEERPTKDGDVVHQFRIGMLSAWYKGYPNYDSHHNEKVGEDDGCCHFLIESI